MTDDVQDGQTRMERVAEAAWLKLLARVVTPALLTFIAWFGSGWASDIRSAQADAAVEAKRQAGAIVAVDTAVKLLDAKVQWSVLQQVTELNRRVQQLENTAYKTSDAPR